MNRHILTPRETEDVRLVADGKSNAAIAAALGISRSTVKSTLSNIMIKWNCMNRTQVGVAAVRRGVPRERDVPHEIEQATRLSA